MIAIKFYANSADYKNKLFSFKLENEYQVLKKLMHFIINGNYILAAFAQVEGHTLLKPELTSQLDKEVLQSLNNWDFRIVKAARRV